MRVLGIDFGKRRIGLALSDPTGTLATPLPTLKRRAGKRPPWRTLVEIVEARGVSALVLGLPLDLSGEENEWCGAVREFGSGLAMRTGLPVHYVDERMTSVRAERAVRSLGLPKNKREEKGRVDAAAAILILQHWLDSQGRVFGEPPTIDARGEADTRVSEPEEKNGRGPRIPEPEETSE